MLTFGFLLGSWGYGISKREWNCVHFFFLRIQGVRYENIMWNIRKMLKGRHGILVSFSIRVLDFKFLKGNFLENLVDGFFHKEEYFTSSMTFVRRWL